MLEGRTIKSVIWTEDPHYNEAKPVLLLSRKVGDPMTGEAVVDIPTVVVSHDASGNGAGFLHHNLQGCFVPLS
jgi:hypothetical protein